MHTIVVHLDKKMHDWSLIEPFFYKGQSLEVLTFLDMPVDRHGYPRYKKLEVELYNYLYQHGIDDWQLLFIIHGQKSTSRKVRLNQYLFYIQEEIINELKQKQLQPDQTTFLHIDTQQVLHADDDKLEKNLKSLETSGYVIDRDFMPSHNMFTKDELNELDVAWGEQLNLANVGLMDNPKKEFLLELQEKHEKVLASFQHVINPKYKIVEEHYQTEKEAIFNMIPTNILIQIETGFKNQLSDIVKPVLSKEIGNFKPSTLLKQVLSNYISVHALMKEFRLIRIPFQIHSTRERMINTIQTALFIHLIAIDANMLRQTPKGKAFELAMVVEEEQLQKLIQNHERCLEIANDKLESLLLDTMVISVERFNEIKVDSIHFKLDDEFQVNIPVWNFHQVSLYKQEWDYYTDRIETEIGKREKSLFSSVYEEVAKLSISKRQEIEEKDYGGEKVHLATYIHDLENQMEMIQEEISNGTPKHEQVRSNWHNFARKKTKELYHQFKFIPTRQMVVLLYLVILLCMLIPYFASIPHGQVTGMRIWMTYAVVPIAIIVVSILLGLLVRRKLRKPITQILSDVDYQAEKYADDIRQLPKDYERYLKHLYRLFKIRKQHHYLVEEANRLQKRNLLIRYHQGQIEQYRKNVEKLKKSLRFTDFYGDHEACNHFVEQTFKPDKSVEFNPIYSFLECQFEKEDKLFEVEIRSAKVTTTMDIYPLIRTLKLHTDKVYNV